MKKHISGRSINVQHPTFSITYGSAFNRIINVMEVTFSFWVKVEEASTPRQLSAVTKTIRQSLYNHIACHSLVDDTKYIAAFDVPAKGLKTAGKTYVSLAVTLFLNDYHNVHSPALKTLAYGVVGCVTDTLNGIEGWSYFKAKI